MAGKKQFDVGAALACATEQFRHGGYANTSIDDLATATGLSRSSLYATFGSKEELFLRVLDGYCEQMMDRLVPTVDVAPAVSIRRFLQDLVGALEGWGRPGGCLVTNTCCEAGSTPPAVQERMRWALRVQAEQLETYFSGVQELGELASTADVAQLARFFVAIRQSLGVLWRTGSTASELSDVIETSLAAIPSEMSTVAISSTRPSARRVRSRAV